MSINYTDQDIERGWISCNCGLAVPLEAGFDFPEKSKVTCISCGADAIDLEEVEGE